MEGNIKSLVALLCHKLSKEDIQLLSLALKEVITKDMGLAMIGMNRLCFGKFMALCKIEDELVKRTKQGNPKADPLSVENAVPVGQVDGTASFDYEHVAVFDFPPYYISKNSYSNEA
ncbi:MAG: hypothetical protein AAFN10_18190 [Bacteroidota bacterium]